MKYALTTLALVTMLIAMVACGGKEKKEVVEPKVETEKVEPAPEKVAEPEPEPKPEPAPVDNASLQETIFFEFDSTELSDEARSALEENYKWLEENGARTLTIEGHTDEKGTDEYNLALGERRARSAQEYLIRLGVDSSRIEVITYGEERPTSNEDSANRRSVFVATKK